MTKSAILLPVHYRLLSLSFLIGIDLDIQEADIAVLDCSLDPPLDHSSGHIDGQADSSPSPMKRALHLQSQGPRLNTQVLIAERA